MRPELKQLLGLRFEVEGLGFRIQGRICCRVVLRSSWALAEHGRSSCCLIGMAVPKAGQPDRDKSSHEEERGRDRWAQDEVTMLMVYARAGSQVADSE